MRTRWATSRCSIAEGQHDRPRHLGLLRARVKKSLAIGYVKAEFATVGTQLSIEILGERKAATVLPESPYDPENNELRS